MSRASITASAALFKRRFKAGSREAERAQQDDVVRQRQAYSYWINTPEVRFSGVWVGRAMSKARLIAGVRMPNGEIHEAPEEHLASVAVREMAGGAGGQSQYLEAYGPHLVVAGEAWTVIVPRVDEDDEWHVVPVTQMKPVGKVGGVEGRYAMVDGEEMFIPAAGEVLDRAAPLAIRIWSPLPADSARADSPVLSSFAILDELQLLNAAVAAVAQSRLVGRGLLAVPAGYTLPDGDDLLALLLEVAGVAYGDPTSAAAAVPVVIEIPKDAGELKLISFASEFDDLAGRLREEAIRRYAVGCDTPPEILLGMGDISHWGQWATQDEAIRTAIEPRLATICDGLTTQWLWPLLGARDAVVWYDTAGLRVRPNRSETAVRLRELGAISDEAVRRETGFDDEDAPTVADAAIEASMALVTAAPSLMQDPGLVEIVRQLRELGVGGAPTTAPAADALPVGETTAPPTAQPTADLPLEPVPPASTDALAAAIDGVVLRALERAGSRLKRDRGRHGLGDVPAGTSACAVHTHTALTPSVSEVEGLRLLDGAWDRVPEIAARSGVDPECLREELERYTTDLLLSGIPHVFAAVPILIAQASCLRAAGV